MSAGITSVVTTYNADWRLERTLESLRFVDEIIIVDMCSANDTVERCRKYTDRIYVREGGGNVNANVNFGISQAKHPWIYNAAQDHVVPAELAAEARAFAEAGQSDVLMIEQRTYKFGREILFGAADERLLPVMWRKGCVVIGEDRLHTGPQIVPGVKVEQGRAHLLHNSDVRISDWIAKVNRFTDLDVRRLGYAHFGDIARAFGPARVTSRMARTFFNLYVRRKGYRDGEHGYFLAMFSAFYTLVEEAKLFEKGWDWSGVPEPLRPPDGRSGPGPA